MSTSSRFDRFILVGEFQPIPANFFEKLLFSAFGCCRTITLELSSPRPIKPPRWRHLDQNAPIQDIVFGTLRLHAIGRVRLVERKAI
jgi:hypothetical protein